MSSVSPGGQIWSQLHPIGPPGLDSWSPHTLTWYRAPSTAQFLSGCIAYQPLLTCIILIRAPANYRVVHLVILGAFGEVSADTHALIAHLARSRVQVARPQLGRRGQLRSEEAEIAITTAFLRRAFSICAVKGQAFSLLGRLEGLGAGAAAAQGRRNQAARQEQLWRRQRQAHALCIRQGRDILRRGQIHFS